MLDDELRAALTTALEASGGIVVVDGKTMVRRDVLRETLRVLVDGLCRDVLEATAPVVAHDPEAEAALVREMGAVGRRLQTRIAELLPVIN